MHSALKDDLRYKVIKTIFKNVVIKTIPIVRGADPLLSWQFKLLKGNKIARTIGIFYFLLNITIG
jgi:hypothetical protein